jgi:hypothetical protein
VSELDDSEFTTARGFDRNSDGRPMVTHPDTGRHVAYWGASTWPLDPPYTGPADAGDKGTWCHELVYYLVGARSNDGLKEERERLGIPADVAKHIAADWQRLVDEHAIVVHHVEHPSVNDRYEIASPIDIVGTVDGQPAIIDVKTASDYRKISYAHQMVAYCGSLRYVDGERSEWFVTTPAAWLAHYPLSAALRAHTSAPGLELPVWELHPVDVEAARPWADMLHTLRRARPAVAFPGVVDTSTSEQHQNSKIAAPTDTHGNAPVVEQPAGGDEQPRPSPPAKPLENPKEYEVDKFDRPVLPPADEGDNADAAAITALKARYAALDGDGRAWVNAIAKQAQAAGGALSLADSQPQTVRRFEAMRALVMLAEAGFADEPATRGILRVILGDVADSRLYTLGKLVAHLDEWEAGRFAQLADTVANGAAALAITQPDGRYIWEFAA